MNSNVVMTKAEGRAEYAGLKAAVVARMAKYENENVVPYVDGKGWLCESYLAEQAYHTNYSVTTCFIFVCQIIRQS